MKRLVWLADTRSNVKNFPEGVQDEFGYALYLAQLGGMSSRANPMRGLGSGVIEIRSNNASGTYRAVYTVAVGASIYVVHAFQKKSRSGIETPMSEIQLIRQRLKQLLREVRNETKDS